MKLNKYTEHRKRLVKINKMILIIMVNHYMNIIFIIHNYNYDYNKLSYLILSIKLMNYFLIYIYIYINTLKNVQKISYLNHSLGCIYFLFFNLHIYLEWVSCLLF